MNDFHDDYKKVSADIPLKKVLGYHWLVELYDCDAALLNDPKKVEILLLDAARKSNATVIESCLHHFAPHGVSGVVVIAESHLTIHTWPEYAYAAFDIFSCGKEMLPQMATDYIAKAFGAQRVVVKKVVRGL